MTNDAQARDAAFVDTSTVYLFKTWEKTPTYHDYGRIKHLDGTHTGDVTRCGLVMYDGETRYVARLRRDHADLFAKPCGRCFPDA